MRVEAELVFVVGSPEAGAKNCAVSVVVDPAGRPYTVPVPDDASPDAYARTVAHSMLAGVRAASAPLVEPVAVDRDRDGVLSVVYVVTSPVGPTPLPEGFRYEPLAVAAGSSRSVKAAYSMLMLRSEVSETVLSLLPAAFTLPQMATLYESIWGVGIDRRNLRRKMVDAGRLEPLGVDAARGVPGRPPTLYRSAPGWRPMRRPLEVV